MKKKKTYVIMVAKVFPSYHKRRGQPTGFADKIANESKIHTVRGNYSLWEKRFIKIAKGEAVLVLKQWEGRPYHTKPIEIFRFTTLDLIGIERLENPTNKQYATVKNNSVYWETIAENDGLIFDDFCEWFKNATNEPMAIIHFTKFRYNNE